MDLRDQVEINQVEIKKGGELLLGEGISTGDKPGEGKSGEGCRHGEGKSGEGLLHGEASENLWP